MQFSPYLNFDGNCAEAFAFYKDVFNGTVVHQSTFGEMPPDPDMPPAISGWLNRNINEALRSEFVRGRVALTSAETGNLDEKALAAFFDRERAVWAKVAAENNIEKQ